MGPELAESSLVRELLPEPSSFRATVANVSVLLEREDSSACRTAEIDRRNAVLSRSSTSDVLIVEKIKNKYSCNKAYNFITEEQ